MKHFFVLFALLALSSNAETSVVVSSINVAPDNEVTVTYTLSGAPAVVTMDVLTNTVSIGGGALSRLVGDVNRKILTDGVHSIRWVPEGEMNPGTFSSGNVSVKLTAWPMSDTPDYMVVSLASNGTDRVRYYPNVESLPGGLLANDEYRTDSLVMRKIPAKNVVWSMGSTSAENGYKNSEALHDATIDHNYYIGVFPVTQHQWWRVTDGLATRTRPSQFKNENCWRMRPVENVCYNEIRSYKIPDTNLNAPEVTGSAASIDSQYLYPGNPHPKSFLGLLRNRTGISFDLPSEAEWEYACRAGHGITYWGNGAKITGAQSDPAFLAMARCLYNRSSEGDSGFDENWDDSDGTAIVGTYKENSWGLYDMYGNMFEYCLDFHVADITALNGAVNASGTYLADGITSGGARSVRSTTWNYHATVGRASSRNSMWPNVRHGSNDAQHRAYGFRLVCPVGE